MDKLSIGQMAKLNRVSERALRLYQQKGILEPHEIDEQTGYRHYSISQSTKLDMIMQLQFLGFSLDEIKEINDEKDISLLREKASDHLAAIEEQLQKLAVAKQIAEELIDGCDAYSDQPALNQIFLEMIPERHIIKVEIPDPRVFKNAPGRDIRDQWEWALREIKQELLDSGYPLSLFRNVGCLTTEKTLRSDTPYVEYGIVFTDGILEGNSDSVALPGGQHLTLYYDDAYDPEGADVGEQRIKRMLDYAENKGFEATGLYYDEVICRYPRLFREDSTIFCRGCLPVKRKPCH